MTVRASAALEPDGLVEAPGHLADVEGAVSGLYREHYAFVWRNARRLGCSDDGLDDAVHEIFLVAARRLPEFEGRASVRTWLFAITFRVVQRLQRDRARHRGHLERYVAERPPGVIDAERQQETAEYLRYLLSLLPEPQRVVLILVELEGFSSSEVAEALGIPVGTAHSRLRAAKQSLARVIEDERRADERSKP